MKVGFLTLGCKVNQYETEALKEQFKERGYEVSAEGEPSDIYVINTCTVTNLADRKSRQFIRRAKAENPEAVIAVTGCYAQMDPEKVSEIPGVNVVAGTNEKQNLPKYIENYLREREGVSCHIKAYEELKEYQSDGIITAMESRTRAYIKIQEGCNRFCTYCIIPFARGRVRSRDEEEILKEAKGLIERGFKEIVLTGINTALYGGEKGEFALSHLLEALDNLDGDFRIRLSSLEPTVVTEDDVNGVLRSKRLCNHLHLSVQAGSDHVLKNMGRRYTREEYLGIVNLLRKNDPDFGITTDIIVGFPDENGDDFRESLDLIERANFSKVHGFRFSPRRGTKAYEMENQVSGEEKSKRIAELTEVSDRVSKRFLERLIGKEVRVLFEEKKGRYLVGYSDNYTRVYLPDKETEKSLINDFAIVRLLEIYKDGMKGELIDG